jgi:hypothetical protein
MQDNTRVSDTHRQLFHVLVVKSRVLRALQEFHLQSFKDENDETKEVSEKYGEVQTAAIHFITIPYCASGTLSDSIKTAGIETMEIVLSPTKKKPENENDLISLN